MNTKMIEKEKTDTTLFTKKQIMNSKQFAERKDAIFSILEAEKLYSLEEAEKAWKQFMERRVE